MSHRSGWYPGMCKFMVSDSVSRVVGKRPCSRKPVKDDLCAFHQPEKVKALYDKLLRKHGGTPMSDTATVCRHKLAIRPILYTDSLKGEQVCRDDLWAVTTKELNSHADILRRMHDSLECMIDEAQETATRYHDSMKGYRQSRHDRMDSDLATARAVLKEAAECMANVIDTAKPT